MSTRVSDATVQAVRERIEDVIEQVVTLRRAGGDSLKGLCPFHDEKSPSFHVRSSAQMWKCFGCQESGDVISFVQKLDGLGFRDAVEHIASQCGIEVTYEQVTSGTSHTVARPAGVSSEHRARLLAVNEAAAAFYRAALVNGVEGSAAARTFLADRGFDRDVAGQYELGYAPAGWTTLVNHLAGAGFTREEMVDAGLVKVSTTSARVYDAFRDRLIFPIRNTSNLLIGFGARKLEETDTGPKYLNTPETILYKKSQVLYGLDRAKATLARDRHAVVVEGYTDVIAMHLSGVTGAVAACGTAFGDGHVQLVRRLLGDHSHGARVTYAFDGDGAGQKAAVKAFAVDQSFTARTYVAVAPDGMDPCDLRMHGGPAAVREVVESSTPLIAFVLESAMGPVGDSIEGRRVAVDAAASVLVSVKDSGLRHDYTRWVAERLGVPVRVVLEATGSARPMVPGEVGVQRREVAPTECVSPLAALVWTTPTGRAVRAVLEVGVQRREAALTAGIADLPVEAFDRAPGAREVLAAIVSGTDADLSETARTLWTDLVFAQIPEGRPEMYARHAAGAVRVMRAVLLDERVEQARAALGAVAESDPTFEAAEDAWLGAVEARNALV